ncbi:N-acetylmuramic acid 6-phosphate etherase [Devosia sp. FJ2-5-3]|uniref:N-acetylmuramic acid 6-phosphate etherase n=1 Tax=Devosia sp. FJ2-5-3 TaxID=2976680 RepID=UPI0023D8A7CD|nr:N-acetylmuramic acid 6-phosphate etherase [Devosia sp. FJ2-5-3]WEJ57349.1 N-acetylmuramic acid 6-phosphate etherase [Devosia sp. FJ2-5-3]
MRQTEMRHMDAKGLETLPADRVLRLLAHGQVAAAQSVESAIPDIARGAHLAATKIAAGGRLIYAAAGSSGLMALADGLELPGTYGIEQNRIAVVLAGGLQSLTNMAGGPEDDSDAARRAIEALAPSDRDCLIAVTASGQTPFPMAALAAVREAGGATIAIANNEGSPILSAADVGICLPTPPELIAGSTRMGAGTAQKIALNMLSTMMAIELGHVHDGYMVNLVADNIKLRDRARAIVSAIAGVDDTVAARALDTSQGFVKPAVLLAAGAPDLAAARQLLDTHGGVLRPALAALGHAPSEPGETRFSDKTATAS